MPQGPGTYGSQRGRPPKKKSGLKYQADKTLLDISEKMYEAQKKRATTPIDIDLQSFQLKSGNKPPFEQMGSSPLEQHAPSDTTGRAAWMRDPENLATFFEENPYETGKTVKTGPSEFETAFSKARKAGDKEFTFKGKKYTTKTKEE